MSMHASGIDCAYAIKNFCRRLGAAGGIHARQECGASLVEFALVLPFLLLLLLGVIDLGRAYYLSIEVCNAAYAGALYGTQNPTDTTGMKAAALADVPDLSTGSNAMTPNAYAGCECTDGSSATTPCPATPPSCPSPAFLVNYVQVTTSYNYKALFPWPGVPSPLSLRGSAWLRVGQ